MGPQHDLVGTHRPVHPPDVDHRRAPLGHDRGRRRGADPEPQPVDEGDLEDEVEQGGADGHDERALGVLQAAQVAGAGEGQQRSGDAEEADAEVHEGVRLDRALGPEEADEGHGEHLAGDGEDDPEGHRQPHPLDGLVGGLAVVAGPDEAGHRRGGAVGEEDEDRVERGQHGVGDGQAGELRGAEVADDGGVGEDVERLGDERPEGGQGQADDLPVGGGPPHPLAHAPARRTGRGAARCAAHRDGLRSG